MASPAGIAVEDKTESQNNNPAVHLSEVDSASTVNKRIEQRAYELYELGGCEHGHDVEHWLEAEREIAAQMSANSSKVSKREKTNRLPNKNRVVREE